jgi:hypothetical protein
MRTLIALLLLTSSTFAQIQTTVSKTKAFDGVTGSRQVGSLLFIQSETAPQLLDAAVIKVTTPAKFMRVKARVKGTFDPAPVQKISETEYALIGQGRYIVEVTTFDPALGIDDAAIDVELQDTKPLPGPDGGKFDNIAARVASWTKGLGKNKDLAACYSEAAKKLIEDPSMTINIAADQIVVCRNKALQNGGQGYLKFIEELNSDLKARWSNGPFTKVVMAEYYQEVVKGLSYE